MITTQKKSSVSSIYQNKKRRCPNGTRKNKKTNKCVIYTKLHTPITRLNKIAFLFLTYDNIIHKKEVLYAIGENNIYIHPKYINKVDTSLQKWIIPVNIKTGWGKISIVLATIELLRVSLQNPENNWFVLLSQDVFPIANHTQITQYITSLKKSVFNFIEQIGEIYKASQFWILTRKDATTIINNYDKYIEYIHNSTNPTFKQVIVDEYFFLSLLHWAISNYTYIKKDKPVYTWWLKHIFMYHPVIYNCMYDFDIEQMKQTNSLFLRKTREIFTGKVQKVNNKNTVFVVALTKQLVNDLTRPNSKIRAFLQQPNIDTIFLSSIVLTDVPKYILNIPIYIIEIKWERYREAMLNLCYVYPFYKWNSVYFIPPNFSILQYKNAEIIKEKTGLFDADIKNSPADFVEGAELTDMPIFSCIIDKKGNKAYKMVHSPHIK